ncbi:MAG: hypothetical protein E7157_04315 [Lactobacillales bacterium]|nr:hypothetical protein [Lactobacillales bacterium]
MDKNKKWCIIFFSEFLILLLFIILATGIIDPFFHYHKPLSSLEYPINNQRYQNDGIIKHFNYNTLITGTSMTENFMTSEVDEVFQTKSIKVPFSGASFKEINQNLEKATYNNDEIKYIIRGIDFGQLMHDKDDMEYDLSSYPTYLYNSNLIDDTKYLLNKDVLFNNTIEVLLYTLSGKKTTTFDQYSNWNDFYIFGKESLDKKYKRTKNKKDNESLTKREKQIVIENVNQNLLQIIKENKDIQFYYFYTPYSIYYWDKINNEGNLLKQIEAEKITTETLLEFDNVYIFSFWNNIEMISNLNNYKDIIHYSSSINSNILHWMKDKEYLLTKNNYIEYYNEIENIYYNYDYDSLFED